MYSPTNRRRKKFRPAPIKRNVDAYHYTFSSAPHRRRRGVVFSFLEPIIDFAREKGTAKTIGYTVLIVILFIATLFLWYSKDLPNPYKINRLPIAQSTKILDRNGETLYEIHGEENRTLVKFEDIPDNVKKATVAIEDEDFYRHAGFNIRGIVRAFVYDLTHSGPSQGGSTITQQYVKNALLTSQKKISRKIKELILSIEIEQIYTKNEILGMYLNEIPYGNNAYGVQAAAQTYFGKDVKDVNLAEAAVLAAIPQAPTYYNPYGSNSDLLLKRKNITLDKMVELKLIDKNTAESAKKEEIKFVARDYGIKAPHFVMYIKELLAAEYGEETLQNGGLVVTTSLDLEKQKIAEEAMEKYKDTMISKGASNAALISVDPKTGQILAMVGSVDYFDTENDGNVNVTIRPRQPGSSIKPIIYSAAFEKGYSPATMLMDVKTDFGSDYVPQNYDRNFRGPVSIRYALGNSLNIPAVKTLYMVGVKEACDMAQKLGIKSLNDPDRYGLSLVLGGGEVKLVEMAQAFSVFANSGVKHDLVPILKVQNNKGKTLEEYKEEKDKGQEVLSKNVAYMISNVLSDDNARSSIFGAGSLLTLPDRPVAAKTGTTDEYRDAWTIGYTPSLVTGVWAGNNDNTPMKHEGGYGVAAPIWNYYMRRALAGTTVEQFEVPDGVETVTVDALTGLLPLENIPDELKDKLPTKSEIFLKDFVPTKQDDVHKIVKVLKNENQSTTTTTDTTDNANYKVAGPNCPPGLVEYKVFSEFHSEETDLENWENPVLEWAKAKGYNNIPTEEQDCKEFVNTNKPEVSITSPKNNQMVEAPISVSISYKSSNSIEKAEYFLDEEKFAETLNPPFNLESTDVPSAAIGKMSLKVKVTDSIGLTATDTINITIKQSSNPLGVSLSIKEQKTDSIVFQASTSGVSPETINKVELYVNSQNVGTMDKSGDFYSYAWSIDQQNVPGNFVFYAKAYSGDKSKQSNIIFKKIE